MKDVRFRRGLGGPQGRCRAAAVRGAVAAGVLAAAVLAGGASVVVAQDPTAAAPSPVASAGAQVGGQIDPRSSGEGPGLEAEPLIVMAGVILLGLAAVGGTLIYVRVTRQD